MIIYLCIKFQSNTPILSEDIAWKPFVLRTGWTGNGGGINGGGIKMFKSVDEDMLEDRQWTIGIL